MITVHHLNNSRSQRVLWLLEELGMPYEIKPYQRNASTNLAPPELLQVHPLGKSPVITDGDITVAETGAVIEYLVDNAGGRLRPSAGTPEHRRYTYWLHFAEGSAMSPLLMTLILGRIRKSGPFFVKPITRAHRRHRARHLRDAEHQSPARRSWSPSCRAGPGSPATTSARPTCR